jgi:hypothetical protein
MGRNKARIAGKL